MTDEQICDEVSKQFAHIKTIRLLHEPLWDLGYKLFLPRRWDMGKSIKLGERYGVSIYDANPAQAARKFSFGYSGQMVERDSGDQWQGFEVPDQDLMKVDSVKEYLQNYAAQIAYGYRRSTFYREFPPLIKEASVTCGVMTADSDIIADRVVFRNSDPRDHWLGVDQYGDVDVDFFRLDMTAKTMNEKFDIDSLPKTIVDDMGGKDGKGKNRNPYSEHEVIQAVYKNGSVRYDSVMPSDKPYISFYLTASEKGGKTWTLLKTKTESGGEPEQGFGVDYKPVNLRLGERTKSGYPISMASDALTAAVYGNLLSKHTLHASHEGVQPATLASETLRDQILLNKLNPGSTTFVANADDRIEAINKNIDYKIGVDQVLKNDDIVNDIFFITFLELMTRRADVPIQREAQVLGMQEEKLGLMGAIVDATEDDALEPCTEIIAQHETNRLPDMPQELLDYINENGRMSPGGGKEIKTSTIYMGKLHRLRRQLPQSRSSIEQIAIMREFSTLAPNALVLIKMRKTLERILVKRGMPMDELNSDADLAKIDAAIEAAQQEEKQLETAERMAKIVPSVTKDVEPNSPAALVAGE